MGRGTATLALSCALVGGCGRTGLLPYDDWESAGAAGYGVGAVGQGGLTSSGGAGAGGAGSGAAAGIAGSGFGGLGGAGFGGAGFGGAGFGGVSGAPLGGAGGAGVAGSSTGGVPAGCGTFVEIPDTGPSPPMCAPGRAPYSVLVDYRPYKGTVSPSTLRPFVSLAACNFNAIPLGTGSLTSDVLAGIDVLLFMPKQTLLDPAEKEVARAFVAEGHSVLVYVDYSSEFTVGTAATYQDVLDLVGAVYGDTNTGPGPLFTTLARHPITEGVRQFSVYAASAVSGSGYMALASLGCPLLIAKDTGTSRFVVNGDSTPMFGGSELDAHDNNRLFLQTMEWLVHER